MSTLPEPTEAIRERWERDGFVVVRQVFPGDELLRLRVRPRPRSRTTFSESDSNLWSLSSWSIGANREYPQYSKRRGAARQRFLHRRQTARRKEARLLPDQCRQGPIQSFYIFLRNYLNSGRSDAFWRRNPSRSMAS